MNPSRGNEPGGARDVPVGGDQQGLQRDRVVVSGPGVWSMVPDTNQYNLSKLHRQAVFNPDSSLLLMGCIPNRSNDLGGRGILHFQWRIHQCMPSSQADWLAAFSYFCSSLDKKIYRKESIGTSILVWVGTVGCSRRTALEWGRAKSL